MRLLDGVRARGRRFLGVGTGTLLAVCLVIRWHAGVPLEGSDTAVYLAAGHAVASGGDPYAVRVFGEGRPFVYTPWAALLFSGLTAIPTFWIVRLQALLSASCLALTGLYVHRRLSVPGLAAVAVTALAVLSEPAFSALHVGQVDPLLMAMVVLDLLVVPRRHRGWLIGLSGAVKLTPLVFVLVLILDKDARSFLRAVGTMVATVLVGFLVLPGPSRFFWGGGGADVGRFEMDAGPRLDNQSARATLLRLARLESMPLWATIAVTVVCLTVGALLAARVGRQGDLIAGMGVVAVTMLLASPVAWTAHWVWVSVAIPLLWARGPRSIAVLGLLVVSISPMLLIADDYYHDLRELSLPWYLQPAASSYALMGILLLTALRPAGPTEPPDAMPA